MIIITTIGRVVWALVGWTPSEQSKLDLTLLECRPSLSLGTRLGRPMQIRSTAFVTCASKQVVRRRQTPPPPLKWSVNILWYLAVVHRTFYRSSSSSRRAAPVTFFMCALHDFLISCWIIVVVVVLHQQHWRGLMVVEVPALVRRLVVSNKICNNQRSSYPAEQKDLEDRGRGFHHVLSPWNSTHTRLCLDAIFHRPRSCTVPQSVSHVRVTVWCSCTQCLFLASL